MKYQVTDEEVEALRKIVKLAERVVTLWTLGCGMSFHECMSKLKVALEEIPSTPVMASTPERPKLELARAQWQNYKRGRQGLQTASNG
jgi:hypothetical protein